MATFFIHNFGCRVTQADASAIRQSLLSRGYSTAHSDDAADVIVLNTCTVTAAADAEARETVRRMHRANPRARIVVTGCYSQRAPEELAALEGVSLVVGNSHQVEIAELLGAARDFIPVSQLAPRAFPVAPVHCSAINEDKTIVVAPPAESMQDLTRPILKIQDGCNHRCSYCVIPSVRGKSRSLLPDEVISAVRQMVEAGAREIVLSGIDLGSYGRTLSPRATLPELIRRILDETGLDRLRISSIEPMDVTSDLVALVASSDRIAPHFHMPLQSGSDRILRAMHRWYRTSHYARRVELIRGHLPPAAIGADVIAGFPGESEEDHRLTVQFLENLPLSYLHVFSFSPRPGTEAASLAAAPAVPPQEIQRRARELRALSVEKATAFRSSQSGRTLRVLTLGRANAEWTQALSGNYLKVRIRGHWPRNRWFDVELNDSETPLVAAQIED
jgi:threonylcarbamoyladenosine tRNA methylthiotransferase MtaB